MVEKSLLGIRRVEGAFTISIINIKLNYQTTKRMAMGFIPLDPHFQLQQQNETTTSYGLTYFYFMSLTPIAGH